MQTASQHRSRLSGRSLRRIIGAALVLWLMPSPAPTAAKPLAGRAAQPSGVTTIARFATTAPLVVLTFDTDTVHGHEETILDILAAKGVPATFAVTGSWASRNPDTLKRMVREGHALISHSWSHPFFTRISSAQRSDELHRTEDLVRSLTGVELRPYFRPPYGDYNDAVLADLAANGYRYNIWWTVDSDGWRGLTPPQVLNKVLAHIVPGAIVLMHSNVLADVGTLAALIDQIRALGYGFARVTDFASDAPVAPLPETRVFPETGHVVGHGFLRFWERFGGLEVFGYPLTEEHDEDGVTVQYFERARFEYRPGQAPNTYDVTLGRIGSEVAARGRGGPAFQPTEPNNNPDCSFFPESHHHLCYGFRTFWEAHGGLPIFGYPISEEHDEDGVTVQYFERARFEYYPGDVATGSGPVILLSRLGAEILTPRG